MTPTPVKVEALRRELQFATLEWVAWFNHRRLLEPIGYVPPVEHEEAYYRHQQAPAELATLTLRALRRTRRGSRHEGRETC
jgi:hypothetical protein